MGIQGYAQLHVTKKNRESYSFRFGIYNLFGEKTEGVEEIRLIRTKKLAKEVAKVFAQHAMIARKLSHVTIYVDGVQLI